MLDIEKFVLAVTAADSVYKIQVIQRLWSGYGDIVRYGLSGCDRSSVIVKHVKPAGQGGLSGFRQGWTSDLSHQRKLRSYQIETAWYSNWSERCDQECRVPECLACQALDDEVLMILEDLDAAGFAGRRNAVNDTEMRACLHWLANFHATFIDERAADLWPTGTYWHLDTRPDELQALNDIALKMAAAEIDRKLRDSSYQTIVHGDAKLANFCFTDDGSRVAAVDFQYVGGGCGMKDLAYFIGSCLDEDDSQRQESALLDIYFAALKQAIQTKDKPVDVAALEHDWRALFPVAWTDFHRFLKGWSPGYWEHNSYSERLARQVVAELQH